MARAKSCKLTYKNKRYDSEKELKLALRKELKSLSLNIEPFDDLNIEEQKRLQKNEEQAILIREALNTDTFIEGMSLSYQEKFTQILTNKVMEFSSRVSEAREKEDRKVSITRVKTDFVSKTSKFILLGEARILQNKDLIGFLEKFGNSKKTLDRIANNSTSFKHSDFYKDLRTRKNPIDVIKKENKTIKEGTRQASLAIKNLDILVSFALRKIKVYNLVNTYLTKVKEGEAIDYHTDEEISGKNTGTTYMNEASFTLNGKDQLHPKVKDLLIGISQAVYIGEDNKGKSITKDVLFFGSKYSVPFDRLYDEIMIAMALAYNEFHIEKNTNTLFEQQMTYLEQHIPNKPYFNNVIKKLRKATKGEQNAFVTNMSKAAVNHFTSYMSESTKSVEGALVYEVNYTNKPTNTNSNAEVLLSNMEDRFFSSGVVKETKLDGTIVFNKTNLSRFFRKAKQLEREISEAKRNQKKELNELAGARLILHGDIKRRLTIIEEELLEDIQQSFSDLGFDFNKDFIRAFYAKGYYVKGAHITVTNFATNPRGFIKVLENNLYPVKDKPDYIAKVNDSNNIIFKDGFLKSFARFVALYDTQLYSSSYKNGEGNNVYGLALAKFLTDRLKDLKTDKKLLRDLAEDVYSGGSLLLNELYNEDTDKREDTPFSSFFSFFTFDSSVYFSKYITSKKLNKLSDAGFEQVALNFWFNKGNQFRLGSVEEKDGRARELVVDGERKAYSFRNGKMFAPNFSDSSITMGFNSMIYKVIMDEGEDTLKKDSVLYDLVLQEVVYPEYNRILAQQDNQDRPNKKGYKNGASLFYAIPELNYSGKDERTHILYETIEGQIPRDATGKIAYKLLKPLESDSRIKDHIREIVIEHIENLKKDKVEQWRDSKIIIKDTFKKIDKVYKSKANKGKNLAISVDAVAYEFVINYLISDSNFFRLFAGDPANYFKSDHTTIDEKTGEQNPIFEYIYEITPAITDTYAYEEQVEMRTKEVIGEVFDNLGKRLAGIIAPGTDIIADPEERMAWAVFTDMSGKMAVSTNIAYYEKLFGKSEAKEFYGTLRRTDAQGYSTLKEWATIEHKRGSISELQRDQLIREEAKGDRLSKKNIDLIKTVLRTNLLNPYKPVYFNNYKDTNYFRSLYIKQSTLPLVEFLTRNLPIDNLRKAMVRDDVGNVVFATAVKVGQPISTYNPFDAEGEFREDISFKENGVNRHFVLTSPRQGHKMQLDTPLNKEGITDASQPRKLIFSDVLRINDFVHPFTRAKVNGQTLRTDFNALYVDIFENNYNQLAKDIGYDEVTGKLNLNFLQKLLKEEFEERGYPLSDLEYLQIIPKIIKGKKSTTEFHFRQPLWTSTISAKVESLLVSIINNRVRTLKVQGHSFILGSEVGFKPKKLLEGKDATEFINKNGFGFVYDKEWWERGDRQLQPQREGKDKDGNIITLPAEIMIPSIFRLPKKKGEKQGRLIKAEEFVGKDGFIDHKKLPKELLEMFGYRIPTQKLSNMAYVKVVALMPDAYSDFILTPAEFTAQMGSDFDIDKFFINFYSYNVDDNENLTKMDSAVPSKDGKSKYDEFYELQSTEIRNKRLVNSILDIKLAVLSNPNEEVQKKILSPLDKNVFKELSDAIEERYSDPLAFYSPMSQTSFKNKYLSGTNGREAIGVFARAMTLNALLQNNNIDTHHFQKFEKDPNSGEYVAKPLYFTLGTTNNGKKRWSNSLSNPSIKYQEYTNPSNNKAKYTKGDLLSMLISSAVDNEILQILSKLNVNSQTYNFIVGAILSGFDAELVMYIINQPIIREYTRLGKKVDDPSVKGYRDINRRIELYNKYKGLIRNPKEKKREFFIDLNYGDSAFKYTTKELKGNIRRNKEFEAITKSKQKEEFYKRQTAVLQNFIFANELFKNIRKVQETINIDGSRGLGKSLISLHEKELQIGALPSIPISNIADLLGEVKVIPREELTEDVTQSLKVKGYLHFRDYSEGTIFIKPTTIFGAMAMYGVVNGNKIFNSDKTLFPYNSTLLSRLTDVAYEDLQTFFSQENFDERVDIRRKSMNYVRQFLYSELFDELFEEDMIAERKRLIIGTDKIPSFVTILSEIRKTGIQRFSESEILTRLEIKEGTESTLGTINFRATSETTQMNFISNSIKELLEDTSVWYETEDIKYRGVDIALDLIRYQYATSSVQFRRQFLKYLPAEVFEALGINEKLRDFELSEPSSEKLEELEDNFRIQLHQHFPDLVKQKVDSVNYNPINETVFVKEAKNRSRFVYINIGGTTLHFIEGKKVRRGYEYNYLSLAGNLNTQFTEFDSLSSVIESIDPFNNKINVLESNRKKHNEDILKDLFEDDVSFIINPYRDGDWELHTQSKKGYENLLKKYLEDGDEDIIIKIAEKDSFGDVIIYDTSKFKGIINNNYERITFASKFKEGTDFVTETIIPKNERDVIKVNDKIEDFKDAFNITDSTNTKDTMVNILKKLKASTTDVTRKYLYDTMIDAIPALIRENPDMRFVFMDTKYSGGKVKATDEGSVKSITINVNLLGTLILDNKTMDRNNIHKVITEEFFHTFTKSKAFRETAVFQELSSIRKGIIEDLEKNNKEGYDEYLKVVESEKQINLILDIFENVSRDKKENKVSINTIKTRLKIRLRDKNLESYKEIEKAIARAEKEGADIDLNKLRTRLFNKYKVSNESFLHYYPLINTDEFIAGIWYNSELQNRLNLIKDTKGKTLLEKLIAIIMRVLKSLTSSRRSTKAWDRVFKTDINPDSVLEIGVAKSLLLLKEFKKTKFNAREQKFITQRIGKDVDNKKFSADVDNVNSSFDLINGTEFRYIANATEIAKLINKTFSNLEANIYNSNYVVLSNKGKRIDITNNTFEKAQETLFSNRGLKRARESREREIAELERELEGLKAKKEMTEDIPEVVIVLTMPKITKESAERETGGKVGTNQDINPSFIDNTNGVSIEKAAEMIRADHFEDHPIEDSEIRNILIDILQSGSKSNYQSALSNPTRIKEIERELKELKSEEGFDTSYSLTYEIEDEIPEQRKIMLIELRKKRFKKLNQMQTVARTSNDIERFREINEVIESLSEAEVKNRIHDLDALEDLIDIAEFDLTEVENILNKDNLNESEILYTRTVSSNWSNVFELYFTENDFKFVKELVERFNPIKNKADELLKDSFNKLIKVRERNIKEDIGLEVDIIKLFRDFKDVDFFDDNGMDISRIGNAVMSYTHIQNEEAFNQSKRETFDEMEEVTDLLEDALPVLRLYQNKENGAFNLLWQKYQNGDITGDIVDFFTKEFTDLKNSQFAKFNVDSDKERAEASKEVNEWLRDNIIYFNPNLLYGEESKEKEDHIRILKGTLGIELYNYLKEEQDLKIDEYEDLKQDRLEYLLDIYEAKNEEELKEDDYGYNQYELWIQEHSPYIHLDQVKRGKADYFRIVKKDGSSGERQIYNRGYTFLVDIPKTTIVNKRGVKVATNYYDESFKEVLKHEAIKKFYRKYKQTLYKLEQFLTPSARASLRYSGLPYIERTFYENLLQDGFRNIWNHFSDTFVEHIRVEDLSTEGKPVIDPTEGGQERTVDFNLFPSFRKEFEEYKQQKFMEYVLEHKGIAPIGTAYDMRIRREFNTLVAKRKSKDLGKLLRAFTGLAMTFKHKSRIQDVLLATEVILHNIKSDELNPEDKKTTDIHDKIRRNPKSTALPKMKDMYDYYLDVFHGNARPVQGVTKKRVKTSYEKEKEKKFKKIVIGLEGLKDKALADREGGKITGKEYRLKIANLDEKIKETKKVLEELGGNVALSRLGDQALKLYQLKGMGWNILAGIGNLGYGIVGNIVEAADGRIINEKEMKSAMRLVFNSIGRNFTFHKWEGVDGVAIKIRNLMDRNDILKEASHELYANSIRGTFSRWLRVMHPYNMQKRTEYVNQAPIMIALYKKTMYEYKEGESISLWNAYGKDGHWDTKYGEEPDAFINTVNSKITQFIKVVHGNYDPLAAMKAKKTVVGRMLVQFKTWFFEAYKQRLGREVPDHILGVTFKGRYLSVNEYTKKYGRIMGSIMILQKSLLRMVGKRSTFLEDGKLSTLDAANMRKMVAEISMYLQLMGVYIGLTMAFRNDEEDEDEQAMLNLTLNMINRVNNELSLYANPIALYQMVENPAPAMSLFRDIRNIFSSVGGLITGNDVINTGSYVGQRKSIRSIRRFTPFLASIKTIESNATKEFNKGIISFLVKEIKEED